MGVYPVGVTLAHDTRSLCIHVPQTHTRVSASSCKLQAIRAELRAGDGVGVAGQAAGASSDCRDAMDALRLKLDSNDAFANELQFAQYGAEFSCDLNAAYEKLILLLAGAAGEFVEHKVHIPTRD